MESGRLGSFGPTFAFLASLAALASASLVMTPGHGAFAISAALAAALIAAFAGFATLRTAGGAHARVNLRAAPAAVDPRRRQLLALGQAIDETLERHERLTRALRSEADISASVAEAARVAIFDFGEPGALAEVLARHVDGSAAAVQHVSTSLAEIRARLTSLAQAVQGIGSEAGTLAVSIHHSDTRLGEAATFVRSSESGARVAETAVNQLASRARVLAGDVATIHREVHGRSRGIDEASPSLGSITQASLTRAETGRDAARSAERALTEMLRSAERTTNLVERVASSSHEEAARSTALMQAVERMNDLVRAASQCFDEHAATNASLIESTQATHRLSAMLVDSIGRRRAAYERLDEAARQLTAARKAGGDAGAGIDEIVQALKARVTGMLDDTYVTGHSPQNDHPSAGRYESKSS
jgi:methyl-accepting chemotaxis protein